MSEEERAEESIVFSFFANASFFPFSKKRKSALLRFLSFSLRRRSRALSGVGAQRQKRERKTKKRKKARSEKERKEGERDFGLFFHFSFFFILFFRPRLLHCSTLQHGDRGSRADQTRRVKLPRGAGVQRCGRLRRRGPGPGPAEPRVRQGPRRRGGRGRGPAAPE